MAAILHFRPSRRRILQNSISSVHFYSSNSDDNNNTKKPSPLQDIRQSLSQFRNRTNDPPPSPSPSSSSPPVLSFHDLYKRNVMNKPDQLSGSSAPGLSGSKPFSMASIRESLKNIKPNPESNPPSLQSRISGGRKDDIGLNLNLNSNSNSRRMEIPESLNKKAVKSSSSVEFVRNYSYEDLGKKLKGLRPQKVNNNKNNNKTKFSISELSERLNVLRETEENEAQRSTGPMYTQLRESLMKLNDAEISKKTPVYKVNNLLGLGGTPSFMLSPPKEELVEKYFHPDHMSSAEKQKLELQKVRDKFKISESDCGSSRVQVAQLTTKIKHLATVLHKKDKHSQKGLQAMVQRRKKLLKYLRRTDWDSYCFCIAELGLRDVPYDKASITDRRRNEIKKLKGTA